MFIYFRDFYKEYTMKRKVIQIADSTQLVSLPRKWCLRHNIKKGDELDIIEGHGSLQIHPNDVTKSETIEKDVTGMDRSSLLLFIRGLYKKGYDEIRLTCNKPIIPHHRTNEKKRFMNLVHTEVNRLPGVEVIQQKENYCVIRAISQPNIQEVETVLRRTILLINDMYKDVLAGAKGKDPVILETIEEKHDTISKFSSYIMRLLNSDITQDRTFLFTLVFMLDKNVDFIKNTGRILGRRKNLLHKEAISILEQIGQVVDTYSKVHYKMDYNLVNEVSQNKEKVRVMIEKNIDRLDKEEILVLQEAQSILEIYRGILELKTSLDVHQSSK